MNGRTADRSGGIRHGSTRPTPSQTFKLNSDHDIETLQRRIGSVRVTNCYQQNFVPESELVQIFTEDVTEDLFRNIKPAYRRKDVARYVLEKATKVFAVLIMITQPSRIQDFMESDQFSEPRLDHKGPFALDSLKEILHDDFVANEFYGRQWEFWIPFFSGDLIHRNMSQRTIFPFMEEDHLAKGGYADVTRVKIHKHYQPLHFQHVEEFVRKELSLNDKTFEREAHTLAVLQQLKHPSILPLVGCYTYSSKHNLISPYIKGGSLKQLLEKRKSENLSREELFFSICGIASALWALHECSLDESEPILKGLHQDLNPDNVLVDRITDQSCRFILADFGLSSMKKMSADSRTPFTGRRGYYQAPESADLEKPYLEYDVTRATDVWAFACMMADLIIHFVRGPQGLEDFRQTREFSLDPLGFRLFHKGKTVNEAVGSYLKVVSKEDGSMSMLNMEKLVLNMLQLDPAHRPKASEITAELCKITIEAFCEKIIGQFDKLPPSWEVLIEKSRFRAWLSCQTSEFFHSLPGATKANQTFEATVDLLRHFAERLQALDESDVNLDSHALWHVRSLNTQLSSMLSPNTRFNSQSRFEQTLFNDGLLAGLDLNSPDLAQVLGEKSRINQMALTGWLVALAGTGAAPTSQLSFKKLSRKDFTKSKRNQISVAELSQTPESPGEMMLLETVPYHDPLTGKRLLSRLQNLCNLLSNRDRPKKLRTPTLSALCNNETESCYDLLFEIPGIESAKSYQIVPVTLYKTLTEKEVSGRWSLERRLSLALRLVEAVAAFHVLNWFHKDLTSSNVLFFPRPITPPTAKSYEPYLCGFGHSRGAAEEFTQGPSHDKKQHRYHFPGYVSRTNTFLRQYDWYSLGVVLLEIGFWQPIDVIMKDHARESNEAFSRKLREEKLPSLSFYLGTDFVDIVRFCLNSPTSDFSEQPDGVFEEKVVLPLRTLAGRFAGMSLSRKRKAANDADDSQERAARRRHL